MRPALISLAAAALALPASALLAQPILITGIETDSVGDPPGFPPSAAGEWTRFGATFDALGITTDPAEVDAGAQALAIGANLTPDGAWGMGVEYGLSAPITDMSGKSVISFRMRQTNPGAQRVFFSVVENDGDIWESSVLRNPGVEYETFSEDIANTLSLVEPGGDGVLDLDNLRAIRFIILRNGQTDLYSTFFVDEIYYNADAAPPGALPTVTNMDPPDFYAAGFPVGAEGEWTRFGSAFDDAGLVENPSEATSGSFFLQLDAAWADAPNTGFVGLRYVPRADNSDWTGYEGIQFDIRTTNAAAGGKVEFYLEEADGDVWVSDRIAVGADWDTISLDFPTGFTIADASGGGSFDVSAIAQIGFTFFEGAPGTGQSFRMDNIRLVADDPGPSQPPVLPIVTQMLPPDFTTGGFPPLPGIIGTAGEWTRFGAAYNGIFLVNDASGATAGTIYLQVSGNWEAGGIVGARHTPYGAPADWSAYDTISVDLRVDSAIAGSTVTLALFEEDGDIWVSPPILPTTTWATYDLPFSDFAADGDSSGDGVLSADGVILWGLNFVNSGFIGQQNLLVDNAVLSAEPSSVIDWHLH